MPAKTIGKSPAWGSIQPIVFNMKRLFRQIPTQSVTALLWRMPWLLAAFFCAVISGWSQVAGQKFLAGHLPGSRSTLAPIGRLPAGINLHLAIGLPLHDPAGLADFLQQVYDPGSTNYHHYLTPAQFTERFGPAEADYQAVIHFAATNGLTVAARHDSRILLDVRGRAADIEHAFHVTLRTYQHPTEARTFYAPDVRPTADERLPMIEVAGLSDYAVPRPGLHRKVAGTKAVAPAGTVAVGSGPNGYYLGSDFRNAYAPGVTLTGAGQSVGLLEADGYYASDIEAYEKLAGITNVPLQNILIDGFNGTPGTDNSEVALDIEMAIAMAPGLASVVVFESPDNSADWLDILDSMATHTQIKQFSSSWGYTGSPDPNTSMDAEFQKMAAQGQSFFQASGDGDAWVNPISVPSDSPYVTSVGGTSLSMNQAGGLYAYDTVWNAGDLGATNAWPANGNGWWGSGGGVSSVYGIPYWQQGVATAANHGSSSSRTIPDVALTANNVWATDDGGSSGGVEGTSCAAPLWAGFMALVNQQAAANGTAAMGFVNPALYAIGASANYTKCFHDITVGNNTNSASSSQYVATPGYDLGTGWGTPTGQPLINALAPEALGITPVTNWVASGPPGGAFANASLTLVLTNNSGSNLKWTAGGPAAWLSLAADGGTLSPHHAVSLVLSLNAAAATLKTGVYRAETWFTNASDGIVQGFPGVLLASLPVTRTVFATTLLGLQPVAYWQLNETNVPPVADVVSNAGALAAVANGFMYNNVVQGGAGMVGKCYAFSNPGLIIAYLGTYVDVPYNPVLNPAGPFTVEFWAKPSQSPTNYYCPVASIDAAENASTSRSGWIFYEAAGNQWAFWMGNLSGYVAQPAGGTVVANTWQHVAGVYDGAKASLYVNGVLVAGPVSAAGYQPNTNPVAPLRLGATSFGNRTFDGAVDEVACFTNALSAATIYAHYRAATTNNAGYGKQLLAGKPAGYWHLDEPAYTPPAAASLPAAINSGSLSYEANGAYQPGSVPGVAGVPGAGFGAGSGPTNLACAFSATSCIDVPGAWLDFTGPLTLSAWIKTPGAAGQPQSVASGGTGSFVLTLDALGRPRFNDGAQTFGDLVGPNVVTDDQWHHLAGVYDGTNHEYLYVDGQLAAQTAGATAAPTLNGEDFWIGGNPDPGAYQYFNGVIDEVALFTNAVTAKQILWLYSSGANATHASATVNPRSPGTLALTWLAIPGQTYAVQSTTNLAETNWVVLDSAITATNSTMTITNAVSAGRQQFYRVVLVP